MIDSIIAGDTDGLVRSMVLGLSKTGLAVGNPLNAVTLVGLRLKYKRPQLPLTVQCKSPRYDQPTDYIPDVARKALVRLVAGKDGSAMDSVALAAARAIVASGLGIHPFDYAAVEDFIARFAAVLGHQERQWLRAVRPEGAQVEELYPDGPITADMLLNFGKAQKLQVLGQLRREDPAKARDVIQTLWPNEPAAVRAELVHLLATKLSLGDRVFLESLKDDRAQSVKDASNSLLGLLPGTAAFENRISALAERIKVAASGLLRRTKVLKYSRAAGGRTHDLDDEQRKLLLGLSLADIAAAIGETSDTLLAMAEKSEQAGLVPLLVLQQAAREGRLDLVEKYQQILDGQNADASLQFLAASLPELRSDQRQRLLEIAIRPKSWWFNANPMLLQRACEIIAGSLPHEVANRLILQVLAADGQNGPLLEQHLNALAPLVPQSLSQVFIDRFEMHSRRASLYHRLLVSLPPLQS